MPILPLTSNPPLPKTDTEATRANREAGECPIRTFDWYRLPQLFDICFRTFGPAFYNKGSRTRRNVDQQMQFVCRSFRSKYMPLCTEERQAVCCQLLEKSMEASLNAKKEARIPYSLTVLRNLINSETANERLKKTTPRQQNYLPVMTRTL